MEHQDKQRLVRRESSVKMPRKQRPESPNRGRSFIQESNNYISSMPDPPADSILSCLDGCKTCGQRSTIFDPCAEPRKQVVGDGKVETFMNQVKATDITQPGATQTSLSLRERSSELPRRNRDRITQKTGRKSWDSCCEPPRPCRRVDKESLDHNDGQTQVDPRDICSCESVQTGPSLLAEGPFCRYDYKLRKCKHYPADTSQQCECLKSEQVHSTRVREEGRSVKQQVEATDIQISEDVQTGRSLSRLDRQCNPGDVILYGDSRSKPITSARSNYVRRDDSLPCHCQTRRSPAEYASIGNQANALQISSSKIIQTDKCSDNRCLSAKKYKNYQWDECHECRGAAPVSGKKRNVCLQARSLDINDCEETQTGSSLALNEAFRRKRELCGAEPKAGDHVLYGRVREIWDDCTCPRGRQEVKAKLEDQTTQVCVTNLTVTDGIQTTANAKSASSKRRS